MPITFPREPVVEMFLVDAWRDITTDVRQNPGISIVRGRKDEASRPSPARAMFTLDDASGNYSPRNPAGQWFGHIGRNTPVRVALKAGADDFSRTIGSGWGTSPTEGAWTDFASAGTTASSVSSAEGRHSITSTSAYRASYLDDVNAKDIELTVDITIDSVADVTGGDLEPANLMLRGQDTSTYYMLRVTITAAEVVQLQLMVGGAQVLAGPVTVPNLTYSGQTLRVRFQADGNTFRGKVWAAAGAEPLGWAMVYSHGDVYGAGWIGVRSGVGGGNTNAKPVVFRYDNLQIRLPRFAGETAKLLPLTEVDHTNRRVQVECAGLLRRLSQYSNPLLSAGRRFVLTDPTMTLTDYWPLEEKPDEATLGANVVVGGYSAQFTRDFGNPTIPKGAIKWGAAGGLSSILGAPEVTNGGTLTMPVRPAALGSSWSVSWVQKISSDTGGRSWLRNSVAANDVSLTWYTDGTYQVYLTTADPFNSLLIFSGTFPEAGFDDVWHTVAFSAYNNGAGGVGYLLSIDGVEKGTIASPVTFTPLVQIEMTTATNTTEPDAWGHVAVFPQRIDSGSPTLERRLDAAFTGYPAESAGARFTRLCTEEGVPHAEIGYLDVTTAMGPQRPLPLLPLLQECVDADQATLFEPRGDTALGIRTLRSMISRPPVVTLNYANHEIAPTFGPTDDDEATLNDITAKRADGGEYRAERATGPLNTADPGTNPDAVGRYDASTTVNVARDDLLVDAAGWRLHLGTIDEPRYPTVTVDLRAADVSSQPGLVSQLMDVNIDDAITIINAQNARIYDPVRQIVRGYTEHFDTAYRHTLTLNCTPASPYDSGTFDSAAARYDSDTSTLASGVTFSAVSLSVATTGDVLWTTTAVPFDIKIGGERMTVTAVSGAASPQTFTVTRSANGVAKAHLAGAPVSLANPIYLVP